MLLRGVSEFPLIVSHSLPSLLAIVASNKHAGFN
jgi:hypothetical protein